MTRSSDSWPRKFSTNQQTTLRRPSNHYVTYKGSKNNLRPYQMAFLIERISQRLIVVYFYSRAQFLDWFGLALKQSFDLLWWILCTSASYSFVWPFSEHYPALGLVHRPKYDELLISAECVWHVWLDELLKSDMMFRLNCLIAYASEGIFEWSLMYLKGIFFIG